MTISFASSSSLIIPHHHSSSFIITIIIIIHSSFIIILQGLQTTGISVDEDQRGGQRNGRSQRDE